MFPIYKPDPKLCFQLKSPEDLRSLAQLITIAIPFTNSVNPELLQMSIDWSLLGCQVLPYRNSGGFIEITRQHIVNRFLQGERDFLLMIDSDVVPEPEAPFRLVQNNQPIVFGTYPIADEEGIKTSFTMGVVPDVPFADLPTEGLLKAEWAGVGIVAIHKGLLTDMQENEKAGKEPAFFIPLKERMEASQSGVISLTEDRVFCERVKQMGHDILVDLSVRAHHLKYLPLDGDSMILRSEKNK